MTLRHHMSLTRLADEGATDDLNVASRAGNVTRPQVTDDDEQEPTPDGCPAEAETRWQCVDCQMEGTMDQFVTVDCPGGMAPYYAIDEPQEVLLAERVLATHVERFTIVRTEVYERDEDYERAKEMKASPRAETIRRLGGFKFGRWKLFSKDGGYIGDVGKMLMEKHGVAPQLRAPGLGSCSIGFSSREQKWYGWSHRAYYGFYIGHVVEEGSTAADYDEGEEATAIPIGFECKTLDDCRRCATAHARSVS